MEETSSFQAVGSLVFTITACNSVVEIIEALLLLIMTVSMRVCSQHLPCAVRVLFKAQILKEPADPVYRVYETWGGNCRAQPFIIQYAYVQIRPYIRYVMFLNVDSVKVQCLIFDKLCV